MSRAWTAGLLFVLVGILAVAGYLPAVGPGGPTVEPVDAPGETVTDDVRLVALANGSGPSVWPYVSTARSFDRRASAVNVVVEGRSDRVREFLSRQSGENWTVEGDLATEAAIVDDEHRIGQSTWKDVPGATRYLYATSDGAENGTWYSPEYQLHAGTYHGSQYHLRVYEIGTPDNRWTVIQAHSEHWDWFTLTHTVDSLENPRQYVEQEFMDGTSDWNVQRNYFGNGDTFDADGWATVLTVAVLFGVSTIRGRSALELAIDRVPADTRHLRLLLAFPTLLLGIRVGTLLFEQHATVESLAWLVRLLYVAFVVSVPYLAYAFGRNLPRVEGFTAAALGFATGVVADYVYLSIGTLPLLVAVHRGVAALAVGLIAAASSEPLARPGSESDRWALLVAGLGLWTAVVVWPHLI